MHSHADRTAGLPRAIGHKNNFGRGESATLLSPAVANISWAPEDARNRELDYEHFGLPEVVNDAAEASA